MKSWSGLLVLSLPVHNTIIYFAKQFIHDSAFIVCRQCLQKEDTTIACKVVKILIWVILLEYSVNIPYLMQYCAVKYL